MSLLHPVAPFIKGKGILPDPRKPVPNDGGETTLKVIQKDKEFWIQLVPGIYSSPTQSYDLNIVERQAMT